MCSETTPVSLCSTTCDECDSRRGWLPPANHQAPKGYTTNGINEHTTQHPATRTLQTGGLRQRCSASLASPLRSGARRDALMRTDWTRCVVVSVSIVRCVVQCSPSKLLGHSILRRLKGKQSPGLTTHPRRRRRSGD